MGLLTSETVKGNCAVCGAGSCTCSNEANEPFVGKPIDGLLVEAQHVMSTVVAREHIWVDQPDGTRRLAYAPGQTMRVADAEALGLVDGGLPEGAEAVRFDGQAVMVLDPTSLEANVETPPEKGEEIDLTKTEEKKKDKAQRGPREPKEKTNGGS